jgi:host factor-I protein
VAAELRFEKILIRRKTGDRHMESKPAQNIQDTFLNTVRKDKTPITIYLVSGVKLTGKIRSFDKYSVLLENNSQEQLIFKHAISTVVSNRAVIHTEHRPGLVPGVPGSPVVGSPIGSGPLVSSAPLTPSSIPISESASGRSSS